METTKPNRYTNNLQDAEHAPREVKVHVIDVLYKYDASGREYYAHCYKHPNGRIQSDPIEIYGYSKKAIFVYEPVAHAT
jgi:hypothetical protein